MTPVLEAGVLPCESVASFSHTEREQSVLFVLIALPVASVRVPALHDVPLLNFRDHRCGAHRLSDSF